MLEKPGVEGREGEWGLAETYFLREGSKLPFVISGQFWYPFEYLHVIATISVCSLSLPSFTII